MYKSFSVQSLFQLFMFNVNGLNKMGRRSIFLLPMIYFLSRVFSLLFGSTTTEWPIGYFAASLIYGLFLTSNQFSEYHTRESAVLHMMIPASLAEKFTLSLLTYSVFYVILQLSMLTVLANIFSLASALLNAHQIMFVVPDISQVKAFYINFLFSHSLVFLAAIAFKNHRAIRLGLYSSGYFIAIMILFSTVSSRYLKSLGVHTSLGKNGFELNGNFDHPINNIQFGDFTLPAIMLVLFVTFYASSFFKLKELEVE